MMVISARAPMLPYANWIDWCAAAFIVSEDTARRNMSTVLSRLRMVSAEEAEGKAKILEQIRDAFVLDWPGADSGASWRPTAADFAIAAACEIARHAGGRTASELDLFNSTRRLQAKALRTTQHCMM